MMARDRRYGRGRQAVLKTRAGLVTAVVACGAIAAGAIAIAAATTSGHAAAMAASPAAYSARSSGEGAVLNSALGHWNSSRQATYSDLASLTQVQGYSQTRHQGQTLDIQRGIVVLATSNYLILQSANGSLHLWLLSDATKVQDITGTTAGTMALTANASATQQAMASGNMIPATTLLAGSPVMAAAMLTPLAIPETASVQVANTDLTVTVTVTRVPRRSRRPRPPRPAGRRPPIRSRSPERMAGRPRSRRGRPCSGGWGRARTGYACQAPFNPFTPLIPWPSAVSTGAGAHW